MARRGAARSGVTSAKAVLRTALVASLVTVLIWLFAEGESLISRTSRAEVAVSGEPGSDRVAWVVDGQTNWRGRVDVTLEGSTGAIDAMDEVFLRPIVIKPGMPGVPATPGEYELSLLDVMREHPSLRGRGVSIVRCDPESVRIGVDELTRVQVPVQVLTPGVLVEGTATSKPAQVSLRAPRAALDKADRAYLFATAEVDQARASGLAPGRNETLAQVPVRAPAWMRDNPFVTVEPAQVDVSLMIRSRTAELTIASVPVALMIAPIEVNNWLVDVPAEDRVLKDVRLTGPSEAIEQVRRDEKRVRAVVALSFEELERGVPGKDAEITGLPAGVEARVEDRFVRLTITRRTPAGAGVAAGDEVTD
jgi:hypothetical protein